MKSEQQTVCVVLRTSIQLSEEKDHRFMIIRGYIPRKISQFSKYKVVWLRFNVKMRVEDIERKGPAMGRSY